MKNVDTKLALETLEEIKTIQYRWTCPQCGLKQCRDRVKPTENELVCRKCIEKEKTTENQVKLEELFLCARVVKVESATVDQYSREPEDFQKLQKITLLCSDDKMLIHVRGEIDNEDYSERTTYKDMMFVTEEMEKVKKTKK